MNNNAYTPGPTPNTVRSADGRVLSAPEGWVLLPPGDAALTRRVKAAGEHWIVQEKKGRKVFSRGVWAKATTIERVREKLEAERSTESYAKRKEADARRREKAKLSMLRISSVRSWHSSTFIPTTPIWRSNWLLPSPNMPRQWEAAQLLEQKEFP